MINNFKTVSYPQRLSYQLLMILLIGIFIYLGHGVLVPIYFSILLAILLLPITSLLRRWYFPDTLANFIAVILALALIASVVYFLSSQMAGFFNDIPSIREHLATHITTLQNWVFQKLHISPAEQKVFIDNARERCTEHGRAVHRANISYRIRNSNAYCAGGHLFVSDTLLPAFDQAFFVCGF